MSSLQAFDIVIIGSGMAGLAAAGVARSAGRSVCILDKGRRIGGRVSTRRADGFTFNHGAQFLTARQSDFLTACESARTGGALVPWHVAGRDAFCGTPTMRDLPGFLGEGHTIRQQVEVTDITHDDGFMTLHDAQGPVAQGRQVLITAPAPQTARLLAPVAADLAATARSASYAPCWTGMYGFENDNPPAMAEPVSADSGPVGWACWEPHRPGNAPAEALLAAYQSMIGAMTGTPLPTPRYIAAHRWRYARVIQAAAADAPRFSADGMIGIAGDWTAGARVEDAFMSGHRAMTSLLEMMPHS